MRRHINVLGFVFISVAGLGLNACSSNEEVIEVEVPPVTETRYDITTPSGMGYTDNAVIPALSSSSVEVYSLDGPVPELDAKPDRREMSPSRSYGIAKNVEVYPLGPETRSDAMSYIQTVPDASYQSEPSDPVPMASTVPSAKVKEVEREILGEK